VKDIARNKTRELEVGDLVRLKWSAVNSDLRRTIKQGKKKHIVVTYTKTVFRILNRIVSQNAQEGYAKYEYTILWHATLGMPSAWEATPHILP
jgi:hypothetical protein